jgi:hypothetical protein
MKKVLGILAIATTIVACNNSSDAGTAGDTTNTMTSDTTHMSTDTTGMSTDTTRMSADTTKK